MVTGALFGEDELPLIETQPHQRPGGFVDGILFHQVLTMARNGHSLLPEDRRSPSHDCSEHADQHVLGWGLFDFFEGTLNHHILHLHHMTDDAGHFKWDLGFLGSGVVLIASGLATTRSAKAASLARGNSNR